ncbi:MAG: hypothetical protein GF364_04580 [Candidatus Lokiarchaeota archaeon]|nr:hypothetical protein [Candidatus Lokiarchaeota archaeon]
MSEKFRLNLEKESLGIHNYKEYKGFLEQLVLMVLDYDDFGTQWELFVRKHFPALNCNYNDINFAKAFYNKRLYRESVLDLLSTLDPLDTMKNQRIFKMLHEVIRKTLNYESIRFLRKYSKVINKLEINREYIKPISGIKYLVIHNYPDETYKDLEMQINGAFQLEMYPIIGHLIKKMLKNFIIDIFRVKFRRSKENISLFFQLEKGEFHSFNTLLKNFEGKVCESKPITRSYYNSLIDKIQDLNTLWNSDMEDEYYLKDLIIRSKSDIKTIIRGLIRFYDSLIEKTD